MRLLILLTCPKDCILFSAWFYYHAADKQTLKDLNSVLSTFSATSFLAFVNVTADFADDRALRENDPALTWLFLGVDTSDPSAPLCKASLFLPVTDPLCLRYFINYTFQLRCTVRRVTFRC